MRFLQTLATLSIGLAPFLAAVSAAPAATTTTLKLLNFNILSGGNSVNEIGSTSPLYRQPRHAHIAGAILQSDADIVGVLEPNGASPDPILTVLQASNPAWQKRGNLYAKFPIEQDPLNPGDTTTHLVRTGPEQFVICHVAHWSPSSGYGPDIVQGRIIANDIPADPNQFDAEIVADVTQPATYQATLAKVQPHLDAGRPVFVLGDFNEPSHLDWTSDYAANGMDRWVANPTATPLRFKITWPGSSLLLGAGLKDSFRTVHPDPVAKPGTTWTPPYENGTPGRRPYDGNATTTGAQNQILVRIDWLLFAGHGVTATASAVVGENPATHPVAGNRLNNLSEIAPDIQYHPWPSDHRAVLGTFTLPAVSGPPISEGTPGGLPIRDSGDFTGAIDPIEGDVDPDTLADWTADLGNFAGQLNLNGDGTLGVALDQAAFDRWTHSGDLDGTTGWTIEARIRIDATGTIDNPPGVFDLQSRSSGTNARSPWFYIAPTGIGQRAGGSAGIVHPVNLDDGQFHTYRIATKAGIPHTVWLDGVKIHESTGNDATTNTNAFLGRNGSTTVGDGIVTIDYIRFDTTGAYAPPVGREDANSPADGAMLDRTQPLYWQPVAGATVYQVWFGTSPAFNPDDYQGEFTANYFDPGNLLENMTWYWRIDAVTASGTVTGTTWSFATTTGNDLTPAGSYLGWKLATFPTAVLLDPAKEATHWGDNADLDGDRLTTMLECALVGDPFVPEPGKLPYLALEASDPVLVFRQRTGATGSPGLDSTAWGLLYQVQAGPDLTTWNHGPAWVENTGPVVTNGEGSDTVTVRLLNPDPARWFARLLVTAITP